MKRRQTARHGDAALETQQLDRHLALVVIHGDDAVQRAIARLHENGVGGKGVQDRQPFRVQLPRRRPEASPKVTATTGLRIIST